MKKDIRKTEKMEVIMYCEKCGRERELKRLELGGGAGTYLCKECFSDEMDYRKYMNRKYPNTFKIENWDNLKKYEDEEAEAYAEKLWKDYQNNEENLKIEMINKKYPNIYRHLIGLIKALSDVLR